MKCPLHYKVIRYEQTQQVVDFFDCVKEECAWWYKENRCCAMLTFAQGSSYIAHALLQGNTLKAEGGKP